MTMFSSATSRPLTTRPYHAFYDAGCRYLQMDDIYFAYLCDPKQRNIQKEMGRDPDDTLKRYAWMMNEAIKDRPDDMVIGMHMCRGNFQSTYAAEGPMTLRQRRYSRPASIFSSWNMTATVQAGSNRCACCRKASSACCRFRHDEKAELEPVDDLKRKFEEASKYADLDQLGIAPQCGFRLPSTATRSPSTISVSWNWSSRWQRRSGEAPDL